VEQTVIVFPFTDRAQAVLASSQKQWRSWAQGSVTRKLYEGADAYELGSVQLRDDVLTVSMVAINRESGDSACQQVLAARANVLVGTRACLTPTNIPVTATSANPNLAGDDAERLANAMLAKVKV